MKKKKGVNRKSPDVTLQTLLETLRRGEAPSRFDRRLRLPTPPNIPLGQLGADLRTTNCLAAAGYDRDPTRIGKLTVGEALKIEGLGLKCLRSYLEAAEKWKRSTTQRPARPDQDPAGTLAYLQGVIARARNDEIALLRDYQLVEPYRVPVESLPLKTRTNTCLKRLQLGPDKKLENMTIGELLQVQVLGQVALMDLLENLAATYERGSPKARTRLVKTGSPRAKQVADQIEAALEGHELLRTDWRLGRIFKPLGASTSTELLAMLRKRKCDTPITVEALKRFLRQLEACASLTLEQEATQLRHRKPGSRGDELVRAYFGFGQQHATTLENVAARLSITRERIRQIVMPTALKRTAGTTYMPVLKRVLRYVRQSIPNMGADVEAELVKKGWLEEGTTIGEVIRYAERTTREGTGLAEAAVGRDRVVMAAGKLYEFQRLPIRERLKIGHQGHFDGGIEYRPKVKITRLFM